MRDPRHRELLRLFQLGGTEARELQEGHFVSAEHLVLALLGPDEKSPATRALQACSITKDSFKRAYLDLLAESPPSVDGGMDREGWLSPSISLYACMGRAQGLAAGLGAASVAPEHVLLAILWDPDQLEAMVFNRLGVSRQKILDRLVDLGVRAPSVELPAEQGPANKED